MTRRCLLTCMSLLMALLSGCSRPDQATSAPETGGPPVEGDWAVVQFMAEPDSLNPVLSTNTYSTYVEYGVNWSHVYETLLQYDPEKSWSFSKPLLAQSYEVSADHLTYTFTLKSGINWHDGRPLTPQDIVFSAKATVAPGVDNAHVRATITDLANVELIDGGKIRYSMRKPYFLNDIALGSLPIIPQHIFDPQGLLSKFSVAQLLEPSARNDADVKKFAAELNKHPNNRHPIGTGPYKFEQWETSKEIRLVRNPDYWGNQAYLDKIVIRMIPDNTAALTALKSGDVDIVPRLQPIQYAQQTSGDAFDRQFTKGTYQYPSYNWIAWNLERPMFKDKRVRQALTMLVPRQQMVETIRFGLGRVAIGQFGPDSPDFNPNIQPVPYDPKRAMELLDEAGWKDSNGDGIRDKDGVPFRFEFLGTAQNLFTDQLLPILKEEFRKVGIDMTERRLEFTVQFDNLRDHNFDASSAGWAADLQSDPFSLWHSTQSKDRGQNFISYNNPEVDRIIDQARTEFDPEKRKQLYWRLQEIIHEDQPYTFLFYPMEAAAYARRFQNVQWLPARPSYDLNAWFVPKSAQKYGATTAQ